MGQVEKPHFKTGQVQTSFSQEWSKITWPVMECGDPYVDNAYSDSFLWRKKIRGFRPDVISLFYGALIICQEVIISSM